MKGSMVVWDQVVGLLLFYGKNVKDLIKNYLRDPIFPPVLSTTAIIWF